MTACFAGRPHPSLPAEGAGTRLARETGELAPTITDRDTARFLSTDFKRRTLEDWERKKTLILPEDGRGLGGRGYPDPEIIPWCDLLNEIPGVCTLQSCAGHGPEDSGGAMRSGHLWLLLDAEMSAAFDARAWELVADSEHIERASRIYSPWGQEVTNIVFAGNERGMLDESMQLVLDFLASLREDPALLDRADPS